ncbi:MAG: hypothetical protein H6713_40920 [Myxococcales bacterium]|nr:hypothetical protein [Myxococcales bacterium]
MSLELQILGRPASAEDRSCWTFCEPNERVRVAIRWRELGPLGAEKSDALPTRACAIRYSPPFPHLLASGALPVELELHPDARDQEGLSWSHECELRSPRFFPLRATVRLRASGDGATSRTSLWLIPRMSAWCAMLIIAGTVALLAFGLALPLSSLRLTLTDTVTGLSSVTLLGAAIYLVRRTVTALRPARLPLFGLTLLVYRSVLASALVLAGVLALVRYNVTTIYNSSSADVVLNLPGRDRADTLAPSDTFTFVGRASTMERALQSYIDGAKRTTFEVRPSEVSAELEATRARRNPCSDRAPRAPRRAATWIEAWFSPPVLEIHCAERKWVRLASGADVDEHSRCVRVDDRKERDQLETWAVLLPNERCELDERSRMTVKVAAFSGQDVIKGDYEVQYPWQTEFLANNSRLRLIVEDDPSKSIFVAVDAASEVRYPINEDTLRDPDRSAELLRSAVLEIARATSKTPAVPIPSTLRAETISARIGTDEEQPADAQLTCHRPSPRAGTEFHATRLLLVDEYDALQGLAARGRGALPWDSEWQRLSAQGSAAMTPWICSVEASAFVDSSAKPRFESSSLRVTASFEAPDTPLTITIPTRLMAERVRVFYDFATEAERGPELAGIVTCKVDDPSSRRALVIGPLWVHGAGGARLDTQLVDQLELNPDAAWSSTWERVKELDSPYSSRFPAWGCWPAELLDERASADELKARVTVNAELVRDASVNLALETVKLDPRSLRRCWIDEYGEGPTRKSPPPRGCATKRTSDARRRDFNQNQGQSCEVLTVFKCE